MRIGESAFFSCPVLFSARFSLHGVVFYCSSLGAAGEIHLRGLIVQREESFYTFGGLLWGGCDLRGLGFYFMQRKAYFQVRMSPAIHVEKTSASRRFLMRTGKNGIPMKSSKRMSSCIGTKGLN